MARCEPWYVRAGRPPVFTAFRLGGWRLLGHYTGDVATMRLLDQAFWAYKQQRPVRGRGRVRRLLAGALPGGCTLLPGSDADSPVSSPGGTIVLVGDVMPLAPFSPSRPTVELGPGVPKALRSDVLLANLEGPVGDADAHGGIPSGLLGGAPRLTMTPEELAMHRAYLPGGTVVFSTANNHAWDRGPEGVRQTLQAVGELGAVGVGSWPTTAAARDHTVIAAAGRTLGVVAFTFGTNGLRGAVGDDRMVNVAALNEKDNGPDVERLRAAVRACRSEGCDLVVVSLHWGLEFEWFPTERQVRLGRALVEAGADIVWGHHPHVRQPVELHHVPGQDRSGLIVYSAGNLVTPVLTPHARLSLAVRVTLRGTGDGPLLRSVDLVSLVFSAGSCPGRYRLDLLESLPRDDPAVRRMQQHARVTARAGR